MKPIFIFICGNMCTGKTTLTNNIVEKFPYFNVVNSDLIRDYFRKNYPFYFDLDESHPTPKAEELRIIVDPLREDILKLLLKNKQHIILNKSGLTRDERKNYLSIVPNNYHKILIQTQIDEDKLIKRIVHRDKTSNHSNQWIKFYNEIRKNSEEKICEDECENVLVYNQNNLQEILNYFKKLN